MRALVHAGEPPTLRLLDDAPEPTPGAGEALVHVRAAGICATDLTVLRGYADFRGVMGHEFVGRVDPNDADPSLAGRRVVADINLGCGRCRDCLAADGHHCAARRVLGIRGAPGAFAERLCVPRDRLAPVPDDLDDERAVFAEPLAAALHVLDELENVAVDEPIAVIGDGKLGLLVTMALADAGRPVLLVGHHADKLALARAASPDARLELRLESELASMGESHRRQLAAVIEASGHPSGLALAIALARPRGLVILKTTVAAPIPLDVSAVVVHELRLIGSRCGDVRRALARMATGGLDPRPLIAGRYPLISGLDAMRAAKERGALKILLTCDDSPRPRAPQS
ncbi:alcohol dehydrogenase catalytic domain-containing protein [Pseudenhygromyxa sp. WMMC2535]|uniref:alcohol dehydrogenase catalytic domain-containing protein n=1 Tax=Pseudenhygromyxa sp. WMMC2535 TaxID=2712867 RepID=UPI001554132D|nr:alcohol dehydrogenase catalytic domain-containing protein [Pseudenhygromyxa sp. WMMC2535]NVB40520.1 alcohol dehydrogenase catalytic domain-containing protein [Pseudenhygromyxa sp. WMMC2535]